MSGTRILVPLDGSPQAAAALPMVRGLATVLPASVVLLRVVESSAGTGEASREARRYLEGVAQELAKAEMAVRATIAEGDAARVILEQIHDSAIDLVVMAVRRAGLERSALGRTAWRVLCESPVPVVIVRAGGRRVTRVRRILLPLGEGPVQTFAMSRLVDLARALGAVVVLLRVLEPSPHVAAGVTVLPGDLAALQQRLERAGLAVETYVRQGSVADVILEVVTEQAIDLVVLASRRRAAEWPAPGSVTAEVFQRSPVPVLAVAAAITSGNAAGAG